MTRRDQLELGMKENAAYRKDHLPPGQLRGVEIPTAPGRSAEIPAARGGGRSVPRVSGGRVQPRTSRRAGGVS
jgi:hypothetical protein